MRNHRTRAAIGIFLALMIRSSTPIDAGPAPVTPDHAAELVEKVYRRLLIYPCPVNWRADLRYIKMKMDRDWRPREKTVVQKTLTVRGSERWESIHSAEEFEKGRSRDITERYRSRKLGELADIRKKLEKGKKLSLLERRNVLTPSDLLPFSSDRIPLFTFREIGGDEVDGRPVAILEVQALKKRDVQWEGRYFIAPDTGDVVKAILRPTDKPLTVRSLRIEVRFRCEKGHTWLISTRARLHASLVVKHIRLETEEVYSGFGLLEEEKPAVQRLDSGDASPAFGFQ